MSECAPLPHYLYGIRRVFDTIGTPKHVMQPQRGIIPYRQSIVVTETGSRHR